MSTPQIDYLVASRELNFPFEEAYSLNPQINKLFGDIYVAVPRSLEDETGKLYLDTIASNGGAITALVLKLGTTPIINFPESSLNVTQHSNAWANIWKTFEFEALETGGGNVKGSDAKLVVDLAALTAMGAFSYNSMQLPLVSSCYDMTPAKVLSFFVEPSDVVDGDVDIKAGYNLKIETVPVTAEDQPYTQLVLSAISGEGDGRKPEQCESLNSNTISTINGVGPNKYGDIFVRTDGCHWMYQQVDDETSQIFMRNNCEPCIVCDELAETYCLVRGIWVNAKNVHERLCQALNVYRDYVNLLDRFAKEFDTPKVTVRFEQSDEEAYDVVLRLQTGNLAKVSSVTASFNYGPSPAATATYRNYSGRRKIPGYAPQQIPPPFAGVVVVYPTGLGDAVLDKRKYASWYWNMHFDRCDGPDDIVVTWLGEVTFEPGSGITPLIFQGSINLDINPVGCS